MSNNPAASPYAAPASNVDDVSANPEAEAIRKAHINREASIKSVGILYYLGGAMLALAGGLAAVAPRGDMGVYMLIGVPLGIGQVFVGWSLRALQRWAQVVSCVISAVGLLAFPVGTLINGYILYLLLSKKGRTIFSPEYKDVIAATPHVKYRTSIIVWIFLALLVALIALAVLVPMFAKR